MLPVVLKAGEQQPCQMSLQTHGTQRGTFFGGYRGCAAWRCACAPAVVAQHWLEDMLHYAALTPASVWLASDQVCEIDPKWLVEMAPRFFKPADPHKLSRCVLACAPRCSQWQQAMLKVY